jgi:hypothetical protein
VDGTNRTSHHGRILGNICLGDFKDCVALRLGLQIVCISIIDTRLLQKQNVTELHSTFFSRLDESVSAIDEIYLAYGVISDHGYKSVSRSDIIMSNALMTISVGQWLHYTDLNEAIEGAKRFGDCFGKYYALPIAVTLLAFPDDRLRHAWTNEHVPSVRRVIDALMKCDIPQDWTQDLQAGLERPNSTPDSNRANFILATLIEKKHGAGPQGITPIDRIVKKVSSMAVSHITADILHAKFPNDSATASYNPSSISEHETILTADDEDFITNALLPPGSMSNDIKKEVLASQRKTPRFLFRGLCNSKAHASGGHYQLNSKVAITPRAFFFKVVPRSEHCMISALRSFVLKHLTIFTGASSQHNSPRGPLLFK